MEKIASFKIDHTKLLPGVYVSRVDEFESSVTTTFDIRMTRPNAEPVMNTAELHTIEHIGATFLRNHKQFGSRVVYFGPMGCRTGLYLVVFGRMTSHEILPIVREMFDFIAKFEGDIPGATATDCGNYQDQNLAMAKFLAQRYIDGVLNGIGEERLVYPA